MHRRVVAASGRIFQASPFEQPPQVVERDSSLELHESALDDVLQLRAVDRARTVQGQQMAPGVGGKSPPLVRAHYPKRRLSRNSFVHVVRVG